MVCSLDTRVVFASYDYNHLISLLTLCRQVWGLNPWRVLWNCELPHRM